MRTHFITTLTLFVLAASMVVQAQQTPTLKWEYRYDDGSVNGSDRFNDLKVDASLNAYVTGSSMGQSSNLDYLTSKVDNNGNQVWANRYNGPGNGLDEAYKLVMDNAGAIYLTGKSLGSGTGFDWATIKYNNNGSTGWTDAARYNLAAANMNEFPNSVVLNTNGNPLVTGVMPTPSGPPAPYTGLGMICYEYSALTGLFVSDQTPQTENSSGIGNLYTIPNGTIVRNDGTILFARESYQTTQGLGTQGFSRITLRKTPIGAVPTASAVYPPSSQTLSAPDLNKPHGIILDASGNSYIFGYSDIVYGNGENIQAIVIKHNALQEQWSAPAIFGGAGTGRDEALDAKEYNGDIYVVGYADMDATSGVNNDFLIAKINGSTGAVTWQQTYHRGNDDRAFKVHVSSLGNIYVVGQTVNANGNKDITLLMYNNSGQLQWQKHYNGPGNGDDIPTGLHVSTDANDLTISGVSVGSGSQDDAIVLRYCVPPIPDAGPDKGFCSGASTTIGSAALPNHTYLWTPTTGLSSATVANPSLTLSNTSTCPVEHQYIVKVTNPSGCFDFDTVNVTVYHRPTVAITGSSPNVICYGQSPIVITPNVNTGCSGSPTYSWKLGTQQVSTSTGAYSVSEVAQSGSYTLEVTNAYGSTSCSTTSNAVSATVNPLPVGSASSASLCSNSATNIALNSSIAGTSFAWTSALMSGAVSGHSSGSGTPIQQTLSGDGTVNYTVTPTVTSTGCVGQAFSITTTVYPLPPVPQVTANGPLTFCNGNNVILSAPAGYSYLWSCSSNTTQTLSINQNANCSVTITDQNGCSSSGPITTVTVNAAPTASISGSDHFCSGSTALISANTSAGSGTVVSQQWNLNGSPIGGATSGTYQVDEVGNYTITVANSNGCVFTSLGLQVNEAFAPVIPTIAAGGPLQFCDGESVQLTASAAGCVGCTYTWQPSGTGTSLQVGQSGDFTVTVNNNCGSETSAVMSVVVYDNPPQPTVSANGTTLECVEAFISYQWHLDGTPINGATSQTLNNADQCGNYWVEVEDINGCSSSSDSVWCLVGHEETFETSFNLQPNPNNGSFNILLPNLQYQHVYEIFSPLGQLIQSGKLSTAHSAIQLQNVTAGIYSLRIVDVDGKPLGAKKVMVQ